jgi:DNA-binding transcriptional MerR regulator
MKSGNYMNRMKLLSIGDMSKLTGASIRSLRYYEQIKLLTPVYTDADTGYRYYSFEQSYHIEMIMFCTLLDIPLKELPTFMGEGDMVDYRAFLAHGKVIAQKKLKALKSGLKLINSIEKHINLTESHEIGTFYTREIAEKYIVCKPCEAPLEELDLFELAKAFADVFTANHMDKISEFGFLCEHTPTKTTYYAFIEVPKQKTNKDIKKIPAATFICRQDENPQIEKAHDIFAQKLIGVDSYIAIESEIFTSKPKISKPLHELRVAGGLLN